MANNNKTRVALVGLDAIIPAFAERLMDEGKLPNLKKLRDQGFWTELLPNAPAWTPTNWATIATGANASTHGIEGFFVHDPGEDYEIEHRGFDSQRCKAEFIWEAGARFGKKSIVFKYPGTWPPRSHGIVQVGGSGGYGGLRNDLDISHAVCYTTDPDLEQGTSVELHPAAGWSNLPEGARGALEVELPVVYNRPAEPKSYWLLIYPDAGGQPTALLTRDKDASQGMATLHEGEWSDFIFDRFPLEEGEVEGAFRLMLTELSLDGLRMRLYMSQNLPKTGHCQPPELDEALWEAVGPPTEYTAYKYLFWNWIDLQGMMDIYRQHTDWVSRAAAYLLQTQEWDIFYSQYHPIDYAQHIYWGGFDPLHPHYQEKDVKAYWDGLAQVYEMADAYLGAVMGAVEEDAVVVVVGDHGHQAYRWTFYVNNLLRQHGLLDVKWDEDAKRWAIDWSKTKAYGFGPIHISLNLKGRDPHGIVEPQESEALCEQIIDLLYDVKHDVTGKRPIKLAITRDEADAFGLYGDGVGDVIYFTRRGYDAGNAERLGHSPLKAGVTQDGELFRETQFMHDMTSEHPSFMPTEKLNRTLLCMAGPGVRQGVQRPVPISIVDVAATLCDLLDMPYPTQNEGHPIVDALNLEP
jgi:predicted AlkP superfamily phosphohydrolase/phosphomutase